jgi:UDP-N-acetylmuramate dehydrogenase
MKVHEHPSLRNLNTFGVEATAALRIDIESEEDVLQLPAFDPGTDLLLGGGSNVLLAGDVPGKVLLNRIGGRHIVASDDNAALVEIGSGENWHDIVKWTLEQQMYGLENLALIPGSVGAAPIQNIGAYGVELGSRVESVTAWDMKSSNWQVFPAEACEFAYRDSYFKSREPNRFLITSLRLRLDRVFEPQLDYQGLAEELQDAGKGAPDAKAVFEAVIRIRQAKLPDPARVGNAGSFFKNPILSRATADSLLGRFPDLPHWPVDKGRIKISAAWMIEHCGLKGYSRGAAGVSEQHALVLVNLGGASGQEIWSVATHVRNIVEDTFGVRLEPEPRIVKF